MRKTTAVLAGLLVAAFAWSGHSTAARPRTARLVVTAPAGMEFRSLGLAPDAWQGSRTFNRLAPGRVVVVQAPPVEGVLRVVCSDGQGNEHQLRAGDDVRCTFTVE